MPVQVFVLLEASSANQSSQEETEDDQPLISRTKIKTEIKQEKASKRKAEEMEDEDDETFEDPKKKKKKAKEAKEAKKEKPDKKPTQNGTSPTKRAKKEKEEEETWKWYCVLTVEQFLSTLNAIGNRWEEEKHEDGVKWKTLEHKGPVFAADYEPLPDHVKFKYNGKVVRLSSPAEEVASFYAHMLDHDYVTKDVFNKNFFKDWRKFMTQSEKELVTDLKKCDFTEMHTYFKGRFSL